MKNLLIASYTVFFLIFFAFSTMATHNRGGEITYRQLSALTYEITLKTYTYSLAIADRETLMVKWGDNTSSDLPRIEKTRLPDDYQRNVYVGTHTFPGPGTYEIVMEDQNRNEGILNIPGSVNIPFTIKTVLQINPVLGYDNAPVLLVPPLDKACTGQIFVHNPSAYDKDGDSLAYKLSVCLGDKGVVVPGYSLPPASNFISVNALTGDLKWNTPTIAGKYNVAMLIEEYRHKVKIGIVERDMQIDVSNCNYSPPKIQQINDICVEAGTLINFPVYCTDPEFGDLLLTASGGPFQVDHLRARFDSIYAVGGSVSQNFIWLTNCLHVRKYPYQVVFKVEDKNRITNLVDMQEMNIKVVAPAPKNLQAVPTNNTINLTWFPCVCTNASAYEIFRKSEPSGFVPDTCQTGVPSSTGFVKIATVQGLNNTSYLDNNNGLGLTQGYNYCYRVVALFPDSAESYSSTEVCTDLIRGIPIMTNVSVKNTDTLNGSIYIAWSKPTEYDSISAPGPYKYLIYRSNDFWGMNMVLIDSLNSINDTIYTDTLINTVKTPFSYKVEFINDQPGNRFLIGSPQIASSIYLRFDCADNELKLSFDKNVPWINTSYTIYQKNISNYYDSIGYSQDQEFIKNGLVNGESYCFQVRSSGYYPIGGLIKPIINWSQRNCGTPLDTIPPCPPVLNVGSNCDNYYNSLKWNNPNNSCANDVVKYKIYYSFLLDAPLVLLKTIYSPLDTTFDHYPADSAFRSMFPVTTMAGCYAVTAVDSFGNESKFSKKVCIDVCKDYVLPNIFTPNGDGINDKFRPGPFKFVEKVDIKIFNRWGMLIYHTTDPEINWDGKIQGTNQLVTEGVYYYSCDVYEHRLTGIEPRNIVGFVTVVYRDTRKK